MRKFVESGADGIALVGNMHLPALIELLELRAVPYVNTFNFVPGGASNCIGPDNRKAMFQLTKHLLAQGHREFGIIAQSMRNTIAPRRDYRGSRTHFPRQVSVYVGSTFEKDGGRSPKGGN